MAGNANVDRHSARETTLVQVLGALTAAGGSSAVIDSYSPTALSELLGAMTLANATQDEATVAIRDAIANGTGSISLTSDTLTGIQTAVENANTATTSAELETIASSLSDIYTELLQKYEAGQDIGLDAPTMDALATAIATLFHYPTDYPNATAHTDAQSILNAVTTISGAVTGSHVTVAFTAAQAVTVTNLADGLQKTQITDGVFPVTVLVGDGNGLLSGNAYKTFSYTITGSATTTALDVRGYASLYLRTDTLTGASSKMQESYDNGVNWHDAIGWEVESSGNNWTNTGSTGWAAVNTIARRALGCTHIRFVAGTAITLAGLISTAPFAPKNTQLNASVTNTVAITGNAGQGAGAATTPWSVGGTQVLVSNNASTSAVAGSAATYSAAQNYYGMQVIIGGTGSFSALTVVIEGSNDGGTTWKTAATYTGTTTDYVSSTTPMPFAAFRSRISTYTAASGTPTVTTRLVGVV